MGKLETVILSIATATMLVASLSMSANDQRFEQESYCEMVELWKSQSYLPPEQRNGHPDYRGEYAEICN